MSNKSFVVSLLIFNMADEVWNNVNNPIRSSVNIKLKPPETKTSEDYFVRANTIIFYEFV